MADRWRTADIPTFAINGRAVGPGHPCYIIAEAGVNHDGSLARAIQLIDVAHKAGADAVKFQVFKAADLASIQAGTADYQKKEGLSQRDMLARLELSDDSFDKIRMHCDAMGIEFLATPFGVDDVDRLLKLDVHAIKTASTDLNNLPLMKRVCETGLPLIVSVGAATPEEIATAVERLESFGARERVVLLHCVSAYPTPLESANLGAIASLREMFGVPTGYSDHTTSVQTGAWAVAIGACVLEKHFTLDPSLPGPDHQMSLAPEELERYIDGIRDSEKAFGTGRPGMTALEADVRNVARKSVVAAQKIAANTVLTAEMLTTKRPGGGIEPDRIDELIGRRMKAAADADTPLTWDMIQ